MSIGILKYIDMGWKLVRIHGVDESGRCTCGRAVCATPGKHPYFHDWPALATNDEETIFSWFRDCPHTNLGLLLGPESGVIDVEIDGDDARRAWDSLGLGEVWTPTYTSGRGPHRLFKWQEGLPRSAVKKVMGIEVRLGNGSAGQSVIPPSKHVSGAKYSWIDGLSPEDVDVAPLPEKLFRLLYNDDGTGTGITERKEPSRSILHKKVSQGGRNSTLHRFACAEAFKSSNIDSEEEQQDLHMKVAAVNKMQCVPPLDDSEVVALCRSAVHYVRKSRAEGMPDSVAVSEHAKWLDDRSRGSDPTPRKKDWIKAFTVTGLHYAPARGDGEGAPEWWPGEWELTVVHSDPIEYRLFVPAWKEFTSSGGGCISLNVDQYRSATKVAAAVLAATGTIMLDDEPGKWRRIWDGGGRKTPSRGIKAKLLDSVRHEYPGASSLRYVTLAGWLYDRLSQASEPADDDAPDPTGRAAWRADGTLWWNWTKVWEDIERNHRVNEGERNLLKRRLLARFGENGAKDFRHDRYRHLGGARKTYVIWTKQEFSVLEQMYLEAPRAPARETSQPSMPAGDDGDGGDEDDDG